MSEVNQTASGTEVDLEVFNLDLVLGQVFQAMLKKPELDEDPDQADAAGVSNEINKSIASGMAHSVTGFGL